MAQNPVQRALAPAESGLSPFFVLPFTLFYFTSRMDWALGAGAAAGALAVLRNRFLTPTQAPEPAPAEKPGGLVIAPDSPDVPLRPERVGRPERTFSTGLALWRMHNAALHAARGLGFVPFEKLTPLAFFAASFVLPRSLEEGVSSAVLWAGGLPLGTLIIGFLARGQADSVARAADISRDPYIDPGPK
ncbi:hypothetical protein EPO15_14805 [bacterium]|nr:MAG: hypothetical protein EPO15_14805 [bacterium]